MGALVGFGALLAFALQGGLWTMSGEDEALEADAPVDAGWRSRPIEIGMPVIIGREVRVVPVAQEDYPEAHTPTVQPGASRPRQAAAPRSATVASDPEAPRDPAAAPSAGAEAAAPTRTFAADDSPAAQAAVLAFQASARAVVESEYLGAVEECFERAGGAGSITIGFVPADDGRVIGSRVIRDATGNDVGACVATAARSWRLPAPPRNALELQMSFGR